MVVELLDVKMGDRRVVVVLGKGGVGKTTVSILLADELSRLGKTLLASFDPARHLVKYLGLSEPGKVEKVAEGLYAVQFDIEKSAKKIIEEHADLIKVVVPSLSALNLEDVVDMIYQSPGFEEEVFLRWLNQVYSSDYRYVVIDTPPTGIALRTLALPRLYQLWLRRLIEIRERIVALRYVIARTLRQKVELNDPVLFKLKELLDRYGELQRRLASPADTSYVVVANPEPLPLYEMQTVVNYLKKEFSREPTLLVMNKVMPREASDKLGLSGEIEKILEEFRRLPGRKIMIRMKVPPPSTLQDVWNLKEEIEVVT